MTPLLKYYYALFYYVPTTSYIFVLILCIHKSVIDIKIENASQIAKSMGPTWGPPGSCRRRTGPMLAPWTLLLGLLVKCYAKQHMLTWASAIPLWCVAPIEFCNDQIDIVKSEIYVLKYRLLSYQNCSLVDNCMSRMNRFVSCLPLARLISSNKSGRIKDAPWASYQIRKIASCACAGNARNVLSADIMQGWSTAIEVIVTLNHVAEHVPSK